jgi:hypothetical protein
MKKRRTLAEQRILREGLWDAVAKAILNGQAKKIAKTLNNDPEIITATKKAEQALKDLKIAVDRWTEESMDAD